MATRIIFVAIYIGPALPLFSFLNAVHIFYVSTRRYCGTIKTPASTQCYGINELWAGLAITRQRKTRTLNVSNV
jgi:hypothetical protein